VNGHTSPGQTPPVLLLAHKRPLSTKLVLEKIRAARPSRLYVSFDGSRPHKPGETESVKQVRDIFAAGVDWDCELEIRALEENLGCRRHNSSALDWFFEREERGIVLEDDCVPSSDFFPYCSELLDRYADDTRVFSVSGDNFQRGQVRGEASYYFSQIQHCWGWASWKRAWIHYRQVESELPAILDRFRQGRSSPLSHHPAIDSMWMENIRRVLDGEVDSWAYVWAFTCLYRNGLTILPNRNLVQNIGFGPDATHTLHAGTDATPAARNLDWPLIHPAVVGQNREADEFTYTTSFGVTLARPSNSSIIDPGQKPSPRIPTSLGLPTPVVFILSDRPRECKRVFQAIREAKPTRLFLVSDAPRPSVADEAERIAMCRNLANQVDWNCELETDFADHRLGRRSRMASALDRVFSKVERAIILEDDGIPTPAFFRFCSELLSRYADDTRVGCIGGDHTPASDHGIEASYRFGRIPHLRGWATWARAWKLHDPAMADWPRFDDEGGLDKLWGDPELVHYWKRILSEFHAGRIEAWSPSWIFTCWSKDLFVALPMTKLVSDLDAETTVEIATDAIRFPLVHPASTDWDSEGDYHTFRTGLGLACSRPNRTVSVTVPTDDSSRALNDRYTPESFLASMAKEDPYDRAFGWGLTQPHLQELVRLCYKTPDPAYNAKAYEASEEFRETVRLLASLGQGPGQGRSVLDFGCGNAIGAWAMVGAGYKATGIDSSPGNLAGLGAGLRLKGFEGRKFELHISRGEYLPYPDGSFDVVMMRQVLHHIVELESFLAEVHRVLRPGGVACGLRDHVIWNESQREDFFRTHPFQHITKDENCHYLQEYVQGFAKAGFVALDVIDPRSSIINTFPGPCRPGEKLDVEQAKIRRTGNDIYSFFATKGR
jgi:SAM-dependent methyltransferase